MEHLAGDVGPEAVREVAAGVQRHAQRPLVAELVPQGLPLLLGHVVDALEAELGQLRGLDPVGQDRPERHQVRVDAGVRLGVGVLGAEQLAGVFGGQFLDGVDVLAAGVEAVSDGALGVLVRQPGAHGQQHGRRGVVLRGDELQRAALVGQLLPGRLGHPGFDALDHLQGGPIGLRFGAGVVDRGRTSESVGHESATLLSEIRRNVWPGQTALQSLTTGPDANRPRMEHTARVNRLPQACAVDLRQGSSDGRDWAHPNRY